MDTTGTEFAKLFNPNIEMVTQIDPDTKGSIHLYWEKTGEDEKPEGLLGYPSVTSVLDMVSYNRHLMGWANSLGFRRIKYEDELKRLADIGTYMHEAAQHLVDKEHYPSDPFIKDPLTEYYVRKRINNLAFRLKDETYDTIGTEIKIISHKHKVAGTIDWLSIFSNRLTVSDFKSSKTMKEKFLLQLGGYYLILKDDYGIVPENGQILLCKEDRTTIHEFPQDLLEEAAEAFLRIMAAHDCIRKIDYRLREDTVMKPAAIGQ